ncbi:MAG: hypothetical protein KDN05_03150, partial [Verrucomicrobiae bacterium]|nr:hypothetical protein [Verrucomicrobiae bacterium]
FGGSLRIKNGRAIEFDRLQFGFLTLPSPTALISTGRDRAVQLEWNDHVSGDFASFNVYRRESPDNYGAPLAIGLTGSSHTDDTAVNGMTYHYVVTAVDAHGNESGFSNETSATAGKTDNDSDGIDDFWEMVFFCDTATIHGHDDSDGDGVTDFFEYLYGSDPRNPTSLGLRLQASRYSSGEGAVFEWDTARGFVLGTDYRIEVSTNLSRWDPLPGGQYNIETTSLDGKTHHELRLIHNHGETAFIRLAQP